MAISRSCPVCAQQLLHLTDSLLDLDKCLKCGYAKKQIHAETFTEKFIHKKAYYDLWAPMDEQLYNTLIGTGMSEADAAKIVKRDLGLEGEKATYFEQKVSTH